MKRRQNRTELLQRNKCYRVQYRTVYKYSEKMIETRELKELQSGFRAGGCLDKLFCAKYIIAKTKKKRILKHLYRFPDVCKTRRTNYKFIKTGLKYWNNYIRILQRK